MRWGDSVGVRWVRMDSVCGGGGKEDVEGEFIKSA